MSDRFTNVIFGDRNRHGSLVVITVAVFGGCSLVATLMAAYSSIFFVAGIALAQCATLVLGVSK